MISTNQLKSGNHIDVDGTVYRVMEFQHVNPGKGAAFVRTKLRRASDGAVIDKTFRAGEKLRDVRVPTAVDLQVTETDPGLRGDTASGGGTKPATLETGVVVQVPLFISTG